MIDAMMNLFFGCRHRKITRPMTPHHKVGSTPLDTYVACLECGKRLHYDLTTMRVGQPIPPTENSSDASCFQVPYK